MKTFRSRRGSALIISMIFLMIFSGLAVSLASISGANMAISDNCIELDRARNCAESGHEVIRYWFDKVSVSGTTNSSDYFSQICSNLRDELSNAGASNIQPYYTSSVLYIPRVYLDAEQKSSFTVLAQQIDSATVRMDLTGYYEDKIRRIRVNYLLGERPNNVFDYGVATKGPLSLSGNIELEGINVSVEASVYIESENSNLALSIIGNSQIAGDVSIVNPIATVDLQGGQAGIGGETGDDAVDNHVTFGVLNSEFPEPNPSYFLPYVTNTLDASVDTTSDAVIENMIIPAGTNPSFSGNVTINGVLYIETPNVVTFSGGVDITGIIAGDGDITDNSATNQILITGNVDSRPVTELPATSEFSDLREETGTFVVAPGFKVSIGGSFDTVNGAIAANGVEFFGNAGGVIGGSIINYSDEDMELSGNSDLYFNRSGLDEVPAGFFPKVYLYYDPGSYSEPVI